MIKVARISNSDDLDKIEMNERFGKQYELKVPIHFLHLTNKNGLDHITYTKKHESFVKDFKDKINFILLSKKRGIIQFFNRVYKYDKITENNFIDFVKISGINWMCNDTTSENKRYISVDLKAIYKDIHYKIIFTGKDENPVKIETMAFNGPKWGTYIDKTSSI